MNLWVTSNKGWTRAEAINHVETIIEIIVN